MEVNPSSPASIVTSAESTNYMVMIGPIYLLEKGAVSSGRPVADGHGHQRGQLLCICDTTSEKIAGYIRRVVINYHQPHNSNILIITLTTGKKLQLSMKLCRCALIARISSRSLLQPRLPTAAYILVGQRPASRSGRLIQML
eukprot:scaffold592176_cov18-Prasinocladus_malaysianus.AAC.2